MDPFATFRNMELKSVKSADWSHMSATLGNLLTMNLDPCIVGPRVTVEFWRPQLRMF